MISRKDERIETIIKLLEEGNRLREEGVRLAKDAAQKTDEIMKLNKDIHGNYQRHAVPLLRLVIPMTIFIVIVICFALYLLFSVFFGSLA